MNQDDFFCFKEPPRNNTATERYMMERHVVDMVRFWAIQHRIFAKNDVLQRVDVKVMWSGWKSEGELREFWGDNGSIIMEDHLIVVF